MWNARPFERLSAEGLLARLAYDEYGASCLVGNALADASERSKAAKPAAAEEDEVGFGSRLHEQL